MSNSELNAVQQEWVVLQNQYDSYEKHALYIKLANVLLCSLLVFHTGLDILIPLLSGILWITEAIWKTFQNRMEARLLVVEKAILEQQGYKAMQYNSAWQEIRPSTAGLIKEYMAQLFRPTVAFPHTILVAVSVWLTLFI